MTIDHKSHQNQKLTLYYVVNGLRIKVAFCICVNQLIEAIKRGYVWDEVKENVEENTDVN